MDSSRPPLPRRTIRQAFAALRDARRLGLLPFIPAGYPSLDATAAMLPAIQAAGASVIEIGIPFSDPIADGPTIQAAFSSALAHRLKLADVFACVAAARSGLSIPLVAMVSYSIVFRHGVDAFATQAKAAGFDGLILPDLPPPEAQAVCQIVQRAGLDTILLVAPTSSVQRRRQIVELCSGFVYYLSVTGVTGERDALPPDLVANLSQLKSLTELPVAVGFGIAKPQHMRQLATLADAAIVGSAVVKRIHEHAAAAPTDIAQAVASFCRQLADAGL